MAAPTAVAVARRIKNPVLFICDLQTGFQNAISTFPALLTTANKLLGAAELLSIPIYATTQNASRLGSLHPSLDISTAAGVYDKTLFSMYIPEIAAAFAGEPRNVAIVGVESHICVTQTALDLLQAGHGVYIIADGVGSINPHEVGVALERLRHAGAVVTSSESWIFEVMGDAKCAEFKSVSKLIKDTKEGTKEAWKSLM